MNPSDLHTISPALAAAVVKADADVAQAEASVIATLERMDR